MALIFPTSLSSTFITSSHKSHHHHNHHLPRLSTAVKASSSSPESTESTEETTSAAKSTSSPVGFGSVSTSSKSPNPKSNKKERARIIRREPVQTPKFASTQRKEQVGDNVSSEQGVNERAFLLAWLGLGSLIIVEGLGLAASGFLPEEWDALSVKYLYPVFTPTVFLFVAGTVVYGVTKYFENEKLNSSK